MMSVPVWTPLVQEEEEDVGTGGGRLGRRTGLLLTSAIMFDGVGSSRVDKVG